MGEEMYKLEAENHELHKIREKNEKEINRLEKENIRLEHLVKAYGSKKQELEELEEKNNKEIEGLKKEIKDMLTVADTSVEELQEEADWFDINK